MTPEVELRVATLEAAVSELAQTVVDLAQAVTLLSEHVLGTDPVAARFEMFQRRAERRG